MFKKIFYFVIALNLFCFCQSKDEMNLKVKGGKMMEITIKSKAFDHGGMIPKKYTCDGINVSPPLTWDPVPEGTETLALICDDPDAPVGIWVHWVIFNLPANTTGLKEQIPYEEMLDIGAKQGKNDFRKIGYGGPCPPGGVHRYYFKIYALDIKIMLKPGITKSQLIDAMSGHILGKGQLMGKYKREK